MKNKKINTKGKIFQAAHHIFLLSLLSKTFLGSGENAQKPRILVAMIVYIVLELVHRIYCKGKTQPLATFAKR